MWKSVLSHREKAGLSNLSNSSLRLAFDFGPLVLNRGSILGVCVWVDPSGDSTPLSHLAQSTWGHTHTHIHSWGRVAWKIDAVPHSSLNFSVMRSDEKKRKISLRMYWSKRCGFHIAPTPRIEEQRTSHPQDLYIWCCCWDEEKRGKEIISPDPLVKL